MARAPDKRIEQAKEMYLQGQRLVEIASQLNLPEGTVRRWKCTHKWENERSDRSSNKKTNVRIRKTSVRESVSAEPSPKIRTPLETTEALRNKIKMQKNSVSSANICLRRPFLLSRRCRRTRWMSFAIRSRLLTLPLSGRSRLCMCVTGMIKQSRKSRRRTAT